MKKFLLILILIFSSVLLYAQKPKIGVALSGGGAKGLAHIGILKAIDSAGLQVNYITGTSMGSIIGALYACGYSTDTIEKIARSTNWELLLTNSASLQAMSMDEKNEYDKYAVELPWVNNGFRIPSGLLESEEIWLRLSEYFFPVYNIKDFSKLPVGFKCIATDVSTGEGVVFDSGEIVPAVRSSMAIPSLFTAVNYNGRKFVDGGIVRNFPVSDVKEMGTDIIIGSNVAGGLLPKEKINNIFQVLLQIAFFREDVDAINEKKLCNIYVPHHLDEYNMGSFASAEAIIDEGVKMGDSLYPRFKKLADSLNTIYGKQTPRKNLLPLVDSVKITAYEIHGLHQTNELFFLHRLQFENDKWYTAKLLSSKIRKAFGTRYYNKIVYSLQPLPDGSCKIIFDIEENPFTFAKLGIQYNSFTGISLIGNLTSRDFFTPHSRSLVNINIGENLRIRGEHLQNFGKFKTFAVAGRTEAESLGFITYKDFNKEGTFKRSSFLADVNTHWTFRRNFQMGVGTNFEAYHYKPDIPSQFYLRGHINLFTSYGFLKVNTLSNSIYPQQGTKVNAEIGYVYNQHPHLEYYRNKELITNVDSLNFEYNNFWRTTLSVAHYQPLSKKITFIAEGQAGLNFHEKAGIVNDFVVGGLTHTFRNQLTFAGLNEGSFFTSSAATLSLALRYHMYANLYLTAIANGLYNNFITSNRSADQPNFLTGYAVTLGYNFVLGPLEVSAMYCDQSKKLLPYINLGIPF